jgi:hypothetical protein
MTSLTIAAICFLVAIPAMGDTISFTLSSANFSGYPAGYVDVSIDRTSTTTATITFTSQTVGNYTYLIGGAGTAGVNVNATSFTLGTVTGSNIFAGFTPGPYSDGGAANEDGFGSFNQTIDSFDGYTHSSSLLSFLITNTSGTWATAADVLTPNNGGQLAAAHVFICDSSSGACSTTQGALLTGYVAGDGSRQPPPPVPEPATLALLGSGLIWVARRLRPRG